MSRKVKKRKKLCKKCGRRHISRAKRATRLDREQRSRKRKEMHRRAAARGRQFGVKPRQKYGKPRKRRSRRCWGVTKKGKRCKRVCGTLREKGTRSLCWVHKS